jgi:hypothetical protein
MGQVYVKLCAGQRPGPPNVLNLLEGSPAPHAPHPHSDSRQQDEDAALQAAIASSHQDTWAEHKDGRGFGSAGASSPNPLSHDRTAPPGSSASASASFPSAADARAAAMTRAIDDEAARVQRLAHASHGETKSSRELVKEQDEAYAAALEADATKEGQALSLDLHLQGLRDRAPPQPPVSQIDSSVNLSIKLRDGRRLTRRWRAEDRVQCVYDFVELAYADAALRDKEPVTVRGTDFLLVSYPAREVGDKAMTLAAAGVETNSSLTVRHL